MGNLRSGGVRRKQVRGPELRAGRRPRHRRGRRHQQLRGKISDDERESMGGTRSAADTVPAHSAAVARRTRRIAHRRPDHARHERHRRRAGLHQHGPSWHHRQRPHAGRDDQRHVLHQLALRADGLVGRAGAVPRRLLLHRADQESLTRGAKEGKRAAVERGGSADVHPRRAGICAGRVRGTAVRLGKPAAGAGRFAGAQHESEALADCRHHRRRGHLPGAGIRGAAGPGRRAQRGGVAGVPALFGEDLQADARPVEDDQHGLESGDQLRADAGAAGNGKPRARPPGRAASAAVQGPD